MDVPYLTCGELVALIELHGQYLTDLAAHGHAIDPSQFKAWQDEMLGEVDRLRDLVMCFPESEPESKSERPSATRMQ